MDLACLLDGAFPEKADEIAIDRMHADNVGVKVGDEISVSGQRFKVVGLIAYVNYATLHEKSTDMMFDATNSMWLWSHRKDLIVYIKLFIILHMELCGYSCR